MPQRPPQRRRRGDVVGGSIGRGREGRESAREGEIAREGEKGVVVRDDGQGSEREGKKKKSRGVDLTESEARKVRVRRQKQGYKGERRGELFLFSPPQRKK